MLNIPVARIGDGKPRTEGDHKRGRRLARDRIGEVKVRRMINRIVMLLLLPCWLSACVFPGMAEDTYPTLIIEHGELMLALESGRGRFIDLRSEKLFNQTHIAGFENLPYREDEVLALAAEEEPVYFICASGRTSALAYNLLLKAGARDVHAILFGVEAYLSDYEAAAEGAFVCVPCEAMKEQTEGDEP